MQLKSPTDEPIHIALLSGHAIVVGPEGRDVPQMFRRHALAAGCLPVGIDAEDLDAKPPVSGEKDTFELLKDGIKKMLSDNSPGSFTDAGLPNRKVLSKIVGWSVTAEELMPAWQAVEAEAQGE